MKNWNLFMTFAEFVYDLLVSQALILLGFKVPKSSKKSSKKSSYQSREIRYALIGGLTMILICFFAYAIMPVGKK